MQKVIIAIIIVLILIGAGIGFLVFNDSRDPGETQRPDDDTPAPVVIDRIPYESLRDRHPQGGTFVEGILSALDDLEDEDDANDLAALLIMGSSLNLLKEKEEAFAWYQKVLELDATNIVALNNAANILDELGLYEESAATWLQLLEEYPERIPAYRSLGYLYRFRLLKSSEEIEALFAIGLEATDNHPDLYNWLTSYFLETGNNEKFAEYANRANKIRQSQ